MRDDRFEAPTGPYFLSHSVGLPPKAARSRLEGAFLAPWASGAADVWDHWLAAIARWRGALAPILGADADDICPQANISSGLAKIISCLEPKGKRRTIVLCEDDYPTIGHVAAMARRRGFDVDLMPGGLRMRDADAWSRTAQDDVALAFVTHIFSNIGVRSPVTEIIRRAREAGAVVVVDAAQSAGAVEVDAQSWGAHFILGTSVKYLCGGPGAAFLWANPETVGAFEPTDVGWFSHRNPFEFDIRCFDYAPRAARFWGGTPNVAPYVLATAGAEVIRDSGPARIAAHNQRMFDLLIEGVAPSRFASCIEPQARGCAVIFRPERIRDASAALAGAGMGFDERARGIRLSVHLYTDESDIAAARATLAPYL
jgi:selenocysteine lyase/cysteine desulfurase